MIKKLLKNLVVFLMVGAILLSNLPYLALSKALDSYIAAANIVDKAWHLSQDGNVVDKFTSYRNVIEKFKINEAYAATLTYVGGAEASGNSANYSVSLTGLTGGAGSAAAANDLVIVATGSTGTANLDPGVTTAGYTEEVGGVDLWANDTNDANFSVNRKVMGGTPDTSVTCKGSGTATVGSVCVVHVWRNADITTPMDVTPTTATGTNSTLFNSPSITPVTSGAVVISAGLAGMAAVDTTITAPTGYGNQVDNSVDPGTAATVGIASKAWSGSGAEDPAAWTNITTSTSDGWAAYTLAIRPQLTTTLGADTGNDPASTTVAPESGIRDAGAFTFVTDGGTDTVTQVNVSLAAAGTPYNGVSEVRITSSDGATTYWGAVSNPASNSLTFCSSGCDGVGATNISATITSTTYKIRITPKTHLNMPVPNGASYDLSARVTGWTGTNGQAGSDTNANTLTIDNLSPNPATLVSGTAGDAAVTINWTTSDDSFFDTTNGSVIYRWQAATAGSETPDEGNTPSVGSADGTATVACVISSAASSAQSKIDGTGGSAGCTTAALTNGLDYTYKAFQRDTRGNYDTGTTIGTFTPQSATPTITVGASGTQSTPLIIPSGDNHVGGAFTMTRNSGSANVTSITITENGTVNANTNLSDVVLFYKQEVTCSSSIPGDATQFNSTPGTFNASEKSTVTGTMAVGTSQICVYVRLDVGSGASDTQTMEIRIANPSTEVLVDAGATAPSTAVDISGTTTLEVPKITVATEGTQANMIIGTGDNNAGGAFSFTRNTSTADVTSIIITDTGTVNANANITDVRVYYKTEATCSTSIPVDATLFNSTAGTFNVSEKTTVTGTMAVGTSKICVYVRVDAGDGASDTQTLEIEISNPSTEVTASAGSVAPSSAVAISGTTTLNLPGYASQGIPFLYTANNWGTGGSGVTFYLEVYMRQTTGTVYARLYNETDSTAVSGSTLSTTSSSFTRVRSGGLTMTDGKTYRVQFGKIGADAGETLGGKLVVNQNGGGGADLAEFYSSDDQLDLAEVVMIDSSKVAAVKRSNKPYQKEMLGVVSTQPGIILGENVGQSYPIALVGRVSVRVTTENGGIKVGDYLTSSSTPGFAMRATKAGRVLGQALEAFDGANGNTSGTIMVFVNLIDYLGQSVEMAMEEKTQDDQGVVLGETSAPIASYTNAIATSSASLQNDKTNKQEKILSFLKELKDSQNKGISSEVFVGRVAATDEVITPLIFADTVYAKRIKADSIEGLEILTGKISGLSNQVAGIATASATPSAVLTSGNVTQLGNITIESAKVTFDFTVLGKLTAGGGLIVEGPAEFKNDTLFNSLAQFISKVIFKDNVLFEGRPTFNSDTAGVAVIKKDADTVEVIFEKEYVTTPIVSVNMAFDPVKLADDSIEDSKVLQKRVADSNYSYFILNRTTKGFTIVLNKSSSEDLNFSWIALAVKDAKTTFSKQFTPPIATASATPLSTLTPTLSASPTPSPSETPSPSLQTLTIKENELGYLRVRSEPSTTSNEIGQVNPGQVFKVMEESVGWYKIEYTENKTGWVSAPYVSIN